MKISSFELVAMVSGRPVREFGHNGRTWIEGRTGSKFTLRFRNSSPHRVLAIPSIDGVSVIDGSPANSDSRGWVVDGYRSVEIKGWRTSLDESAAFVFEGKDGSYAKVSTGVGGNEGVIGMKVVGEKIKPPTVPEMIREIHHYHDYPTYPKPWVPYYPHYPHPFLGGSTTSWTSSADMCSSPSAPNSRSDQPGEIRCCLNSTALNPETTLGTAFGQAQCDRVSEVDFERGHELALLEIFYSDESSLRSAGILVDRVDPPVSKALPVSFGAGFCKPPGLTTR